MNHIFAILLYQFRRHVTKTQVKRWTTVLDTTQPTANATWSKAANNRHISISSLNPTKTDIGITFSKMDPPPQKKKKTKKKKPTYTPTNHNRHRYHIFQARPPKRYALVDTAEARNCMKSQTPLIHCYDTQSRVFWYLILDSSCRHSTWKPASISQDDVKDGRLYSARRNLRS